MLWDNSFEIRAFTCYREYEVSVTGDGDDPIPHGLEGYRPPWKCKCAICRKANADYMKGKRAEYKKAADTDEVAAKRAQKKSPPISTVGSRNAAAKRTESNDSVPKRSKKIGEMEQAVLDEIAALPEGKKPNATAIVAAKDLARALDSLRDGEKTVTVYNQTWKQFAVLMADIRGEGKAGGGQARRKSGGRLATVGALTKVKRAQ
jgi:hypothetical protein